MTRARKFDFSAALLGWGVSTGEASYPLGSLIGTPSVKTGLAEDVYLTVTRLPDEGSDTVTLRVIIQPMALWLWVGGGVMAVGTVLSAWPGRRRRQPTDPVSAPVPVDDDVAARRRALAGCTVTTWLREELPFLQDGAAVAAPS